MSNGFVSKLKNFRCYPGNEFSAVEIGQILQVLERIFEHENYPEKGTFILEIQNGEEKPSKILEFEFPKGKKRGFAGQNCDSRKLAEWELSEAATYSRDNGTAIVYLNNAPYIVRLNADNEKRFLIAFFVDNGEFGFQKIVYFAMIAAIANLRPDDLELQRAYDHTYFTEVEDSPGLSLVKFVVDDLFGIMDMEEKEEDDDNGSYDDRLRQRQCYC